MPRRMSPRDQQRMMARMGLKVDQLDEISRVIMETPTKRIIIDNPEVATVSVQGQKIYQVGGGTVREEPLATGPSPEDAKLVASQAGVSVEEAMKALGESGGDLAQAIILLKQRTRT